MRPFNREFVDAATQSTQLVSVGGSQYSFERTSFLSPIWYSDLRVRRDRLPWGWVVDEGDGTFTIHVAEQPGDTPLVIGRGATVEQAIRSAQQEIRSAQ
jgi:hypothetical protein